MKRCLSFILIFALMVCLTSCGENTSAFDKDKILAVEYGSDCERACEEYLSQGYSNVAYYSTSDVVLAVENMKADAGILDEFALNSYTNAGRNISKKEKCEYNIDYCAYFSSDNEELQDAFNKAINELNKNGKLNKIKNAHTNGKTFSNDITNNINGTLIMLCDPSFDNRVYTDEKGNVVGLDVDIAREICNYLGYDLEIVTSDFDELFVKLDDNEGDFIISACQTDEEKEEYYLASDTYFTLDFYLIEKA